MFDIITYALLKKQINAAGVQDISYDPLQHSFVFTLADHSTVQVPFELSIPAQSHIKNIQLDDEAAYPTLLITYQDDTTATFKCDVSQKDLINLRNEIITTLENDLYSLGLSVVDGLLCISYIKGE